MSNSKIPVSAYAAEWNPIQNKGTVFVKLAAAQPVPVPIENPLEFIAVLLMLQKPGVLFDTSTKGLQILLRPVGS